MGETVGCGGGELAMCAERPGDSDISTSEILTSKPRKSLELASEIREHDKDGHNKSGRKHFKFFGFRTNRKSRNMCLGSGRLLDFCPFLSLMPRTPREMRPNSRQVLDPGGVRRFDIKRGVLRLKKRLDLRPRRGGAAVQ
jgi:hypothetical protein